MRYPLILLFLLLTASAGLSQSDSMIVLMRNGSTRRYQIGLMKEVTFLGDPITIREKELAQKILSEFVLQQNYPNPFNPSTTIQYSIAKAGDVEINVYDLRGRLIRSEGRAFKYAGLHTFVWDSRSNGGQPAASGVYFCQVL